MGSDLLIRDLQHPYPLAEKEEMEVVSVKGGEREEPSAVAALEAAATEAAAVWMDGL